METQLAAYLEAIKTDYKKWSGIDTPIKQSMAKEFDEKLHTVETPLYIKVIANSSMHSFIVKSDGPKFKKGDILKPAGWARPAKNKARGNIFGTYHINWTGPDYLR